MNRLVPIAALALFACDYPDKIGPHGHTPYVDIPDTRTETSTETDTTDPVQTAECNAIRAEFEPALWRPLLSQCVVCHCDGGLAANTDLVLVPAAQPGAMDINVQRLALASVQRLDGESVLLLRPTGRHPQGHPGGTLLETGTEEHLALVRFIDAVDRCDLARQTDTPCVDTAPRLLRRLSRDEWAQSVQDLLGVAASPDALAPDDVVHGFDNDAHALTVSSLLADQLRAESERLAKVAIDTRLATLIDCAPSHACATRFIRELGLKIFRRPLTHDELARYQTFYETAATTPREGMTWVLAAMLQSPHFLYRAELGTHTDKGFALTDWELATALSYLAWGTTPNDALLRKAAAKHFTTAPDQAQALADTLTELLADPRADKTLERFAIRWLRLDLLPIATRDETLYPPLTPELRRDLATETTRTFIAAVRRDDTLADLLTDRTSYLNERLVQHYGLDLPNHGPPDATGFFAADLTGTPYGGLLSHGSLMATHALPLTSSPIHRGKVVRERLLCEDLPPPPSNLNTSPPAMDPTKSTRERYAQHASDDACRSCHEKIDPIGFGFERFDPVGRFRTQDGVHPIDEAGSVVGLLQNGALADVAFSGPHGLADTLAATPYIDRCFVLQQHRFSLGHEPTSCALDALAEAHMARGGTLRDALLTLVTHAGFALRQGGPTELDTPATGDWDFDDPDTGPIGPVEPVDPVGPGDVTWGRTETTRWQTGYCVQVQVTNPGTSASTWAIELAVEGTIVNLWSARTTAVSATHQRFVGVEWNASLGAGQSTQFGYCANL